MSTTSDSEQALLQALEALPSDVNPFSFLIQLLEPTLPKWHLGLSIVLLIAAVAWGVSLAASLTTLYIRLFRRKERWLFKCTQSSFGTLWISNINLYVRVGRHDLSLIYKPYDRIWPILQLPHFACIELAITCLVYTGFTGKSVPRADMLVKLVYIPIYILAAIQSWNCVESCVYLLAQKLTLTHANPSQVSTMLQNVAQNDFLGSQPSKIRLTWIGPLVNAICIVGVIASVPILNLAFGVIEEKYAIRAMNISAELTEKLQVLASEWTGGLPLNELLPLVSTFQSLQANIALERLYLHRWSIMLLCAVLFLFVTWTPAALLQMGVLWRQIRQLKATRIASIAGTASQGAAISQLEGQISVGPERPSTATQGKVTQPLFQVKSMQNDPDSHLRRLESVLNNVILTSAVFTGAVVSLIPVAGESPFLIFRMFKILK